MLGLLLCCASVLDGGAVLLVEADGEPVLSPVEGGGCMVVLGSPWVVLERWAEALAC